MNWRLATALIGMGLSAVACRKEAAPAPPPPSVAPASGLARPSVGAFPRDVALRLPKQAQPKLPTLKLWLGSEELTAELAVTTDQIIAGMMYRTNIETNAGMLFVLPRPSQPTCWSKNCPLALSAAYIDPSGVILEFHDFQPDSTNLVASTVGNVQYILETGRGWFEQHHIGKGTLVRTERGSFPETFAPGRSRSR
jgi:uncharacterized membrane protein (UPF0127 family)